MVLRIFVRKYLGGEVTMPFIEIKKKLREGLGFLFEKY